MNVHRYTMSETVRRARPAMPPGRSGTTQLKRMSRPSFTSPRSSTLPRCSGAS